MSEEKVASVLLGESVKSFLTSDVGRYLIGSMEQDLQAAKDTCFGLNPYQYNSLIDLQNALLAAQEKGKRALDMQSHLTEAINNGEQALHALESQGE